MIILGDSILSTEQGEKIHRLVKTLSQQANLIRENWNGFNILNKYASRVGGLTVGFVPYGNGLSSIEIKKSIRKNKIKVLFLIEADDFLIEDKDLENTFIIYIGHNGDRFAGKSDVILPTSAYTENKALYLNLEVNVQWHETCLKKTNS